MQYIKVQKFISITTDPKSSYIHAQVSQCLLRQAGISTKDGTCTICLALKRKKNEQYIGIVLYSMKLLYSLTLYLSTSHCGSCVPMVMSFLATHLWRVPLTSEFFSSCSRSKAQAFVAKLHKDVTIREQYANLSS